MSKFFYVPYAVAMLSACTADPIPLTVKIYGQGANYSGSYCIDNGETETAFTGSGTTSDIFIYSASIEIADRVVINVFPAGDDDGGTHMTNLTCRILDAAGDALYEESYVISSAAMKTFTYAVDETTLENENILFENGPLVRSKSIKNEE